MPNAPETIKLDHAAPLPSVKRTDPAIAAFFCGLLFLLSVILTLSPGLHGELNPLTVLIWLTLGIVAICFIAAAWQQRAWLGARTSIGRAATVLVIFGWILGCISVFIPRHDPHASDIRLQVKCASNLRQIGQAMLLYANDNNGHYPDRPEQLLSVGLEPQAFICPSTDDVPATAPALSDALASGGHLSYIYLAKGLTSTQVGPQWVLAFEPTRNHTKQHPGINVLFGDGRVEFIETGPAEKLSAQLHQGINPPTDWQ